MVNLWLNDFDRNSVVGLRCDPDVEANLTEFKAYGEPEEHNLHYVCIPLYSCKYALHCIINIIRPILWRCFFPSFFL